MHLNITFEMGVTLAVLAGLLYRLDQGQACRRVVRGRSRASGGAA